MLDQTSDSTRLQTLSREAFWQRHVCQWRGSRLSKMAYCQQYSLVYHQMVYWSSKVEKVGDDTKVPAQDFVAVTVAPNLGGSNLSIRLPNGLLIEGIDEQSVPWIAKLVDQL